jgi:SRSO17 transposase
MNERIATSDYQQLHHFISESPWDHDLVLGAVRQDISKLFEGRQSLTGLILDESGHRKRGKKSVGVARQYLGSIGKVDNGQVAVFAALSQADDVAMVDTRLFLPKSWIANSSRCDRAGIPKEAQVFKTKPELALEMIQNMQGQVKYDWIGGGSIYGNSIGLRKGLGSLKQLFVMDTSEDLLVYLQDPQPYIPVSKLGKGRKKSSYVSDHSPIKAKQLKASLADDQWEIHTVRKGTKGSLKRRVAVMEVYVWSAKRVTTSSPEKLRLIISSKIDGSDLKYSLTNDISIEDQVLLSNWELLYRQMQRYWVERGIQDCKDSLGMTDYQVRKWRAWHHHMTLTIMALQYMIEQKIHNQKNIPLLSCPDIKFFLALTLQRKADSPEKVWALIQKRHQQRKADLDRFEDLK